MTEFEEKGNQKFPLICRGCAGRTTGFEQCCCQENKFINILKQHYVDGLNIAQLREMLDLTQGCENFCEDHGYLYEFILTPKYGQQNQVKQINLETQILCCKMCIKENKDLGNYDIDLLNEGYFNINNQNNQNEQGKFEKMKEQIDQIFQNMKKAVQNQENLKQQIQKAEERKKIIEESNKDKINQQQNLSQDQNNRKEEIKKKVENLRKLQYGLEQRIKAIAHLRDGYHDYIHDEFLEGESVRKMIIEDENQVQLGYSISQCYQLFDNIQFI